MTTKQRVEDLEIHQNLEFQHREWRVQRIGWVVMGLVIIGMLVGLFSRGALSYTTIGEQGGPLEVEYERFTRLLTPSSLRLRVDTAAQSGQTVEVWLDQQYLEKFQIEQISPQPDSVEVAADRLKYSFKAAKTDQPVEITFGLRATDFGVARGQVGLPEQQPLDFNQFIYP